jgi:predicted GIY-YIG superfamily endonuclease
MSAEFENAVKEMAPLLDRLLQQPVIPVGNKNDFPDSPGVYLITDETGHLYTGRCKSLKKRMGNHGGKSPASSTFAFRMACQSIGHTASYKKGEGRKELMADEKFIAAFHGNVERIREMNARYVVINDDILQHLFEVYVHLSLKTPHNSFATH